MLFLHISFAFERESWTHAINHSEEKYPYVYSITQSSYSYRVPSSYQMQFEYLLNHVNKWECIL
jgi:hypothetical protein